MHTHRGDSLYSSYSFLLKFTCSNIQQRQTLSDRAFSVRISKSCHIRIFKESQNDLAILDDSSQVSPERLRQKRTIWGSMYTYLKKQQCPQNSSCQGVAVSQDFSWVTLGREYVWFLVCERTKACKWTGQEQRKNWISWILRVSSLKFHLATTERESGTPLCLLICYSVDLFPKSY